MTNDNCRIRVHEILHKKGEQVIEAEYVLDQIFSNGKVRQHHVHVRREDFEQIAATIKKPTLPFDRFIRVTRPLLMGYQAAENIPEAFHLLDVDHSETIDIGELAVFMPVIIPSSNPYMLLRHFQNADVNSDYRLNLEEFTKFIKKGVIRDIAIGRYSK